MMFLAHFSSTSIFEIEERPADEVRDWYEEAVSLHNYLNSPPPEPNG